MVHIIAKLAGADGTPTGTPTGVKGAAGRAGARGASILLPRLYCCTLRFLPRVLMPCRHAAATWQRAKTFMEDDAHICEMRRAVPQAVTRPRSSPP